MSAHDDGSRADAGTPPDLDVLWDFTDPAASEARFRALLPSARSHPGRHAELLTQVARAQGLQRAYSAAHATLDQAESLLHSAGPRTRVQYLLERGRVVNTAGEPEQAAPSFTAAWELARAEDEDALAVDAAHMLGIVLPPPDGLEWSHRALALATSSTDPRAQRWQGSLLNNLGWTHHDMSDFEAALDLFTRAASWQDAHGTAESRRIARWSVARTLRSLGRVSEALERQRALHAELTSARQEDGFVDEEIGECLLDLGHAAEARPYFAAAYAALSQDATLARYEPDRLRRLHDLSRESGVRSKTG